MKKEDRRFVWPNGVKKTKPRECVLAVLETADAPMTAMEIYTQVEKEGLPVWLSTVYRILELFSEKSIIVKTSIADNERTLYELNRHEHKHYAVCVGCKKVIPMENCPLNEFKPQMKEYFHVIGHKMEVYGYCNACCSVSDADKKD